MILSIGMIVKNEEKYLRECLQALLPVLEQVRSELIIVDTGSSDGTVGIAKEFTDKVYHFDWCDDFAKARNEAMKRAKGQWYMSVDADEIFIDTKELIAFFNTGAFKKYNSAAFIIKSYSGSGETADSCFNALRLIKLQKDSFYINAVHEQFGRIYGPTKFLSSVAQHYGYISDDNAGYLESKMRRNLKIMFGELEKDPSKYIFYLYIGQAYRALGELENALAYCEKGLEYSKELEEDPVKYSFYSDIVSIHVEMRQYSAAVSAANAYFSSKQNAIGTDLEIYFLKAESEFQLKRYGDAIQSFKNYMRFYDEFKRGLHNTFDTMQHDIDFTNEASFKNAVLFTAKACIETDDLKSASDSIHSLPVAAFAGDSSNILFWLNLEFELMRKSKDFSRIAVLYAQINDDYVLELLKKLVENELNDEHHKALVLKAFSVSDSNDDYHKLMRLRLDYINGDLTEKALYAFLSGLADFHFQFADAAYFAVEMNLPLSEITSKIDYEDLETFFYNNIYYHFDDLAAKIFDRYKEEADNLDAASQLWLLSLYYSELCSGSLDEDYAYALFSGYAEIAYYALHKVFREEVVRDAYADLLPRFFRTGYYSHLAMSAYESGHRTEYVKYLEKVSKLSPQFGNVIKILLDRLEKSLASHPVSEFEAYAVQVKNAIQDLIDTKKIKEAEAVLKEYEALCPNDKAIPAFKKQLGIL